MITSIINPSPCYLKLHILTIWTEVLCVNEYTESTLEEHMI